MLSTQYINLDMTPSGVLPILYCSQYDVGRPLGMVVYNRGEAVDLSTYSCIIEATRTDGTAMTEAVTTDGNIGAFVTSATMTNKADKYPAKLVIVDNAGNRVASLAFVMCITPATMDENAESIEEDRTLYQQYTGIVYALIAEIKTDLTAETTRAKTAESVLQSNINAEETARANAISAESSARQAANIVIRGEIAAEASTRANADASLQAQINQYVTPSTQQPDEVVNARVGADGTTYPTLGDAIRGQVTDLNRTLTGYNSYDVLREFGTFANGVSGGITYTWNADHTVCAAVGTTNGLSICNLYAGGSIPSGMVPGGKYYVKVKTTDLNLLLEIGAYKNGVIIDDIFIFTEDAEYTVPNDATELRIRLRTRHIDGSPSTVNDTISVAILNAKTNSDLTVKVMENTENIEENAERTSEDRINITKYNSYDLLREFGTFAGGTSGGVTYTWNEDHTVCTAVGTTNALSIRNLYAGSTLPDGMVPGGKYYVKVSTTSPNLLLEIIAYNGNTNIDDVFLIDDAEYTVPNNATKLIIRLRTRHTSGSPSTVNDTISVAILDAKSNAELTADVEKLTESLNFMQIFPKYTTIGDSLMGGFMNRDGVSVTTETARAAGNNWVNYIALRTGRVFTNLAVGGSTAKQWRDSLLPTANIDTNCYLIGIGVNDRRQGLTVGSITDIAANFANNADSFYGNYDYMVRQLMAWKPTAHIFCFTIPVIEGGTSEDYNVAIRSIAALYPSKVHCIDLATEQAYSSSIITDNYTGGHFNPIAYNYMSGIIENAINEYMKNNNVIFATAPYQ